MNVWQASGVGGCDCAENRRIVFKRFKEAEEALSPRKDLLIEVVDPGGELVAAAPSG